VAGGLTGGRAGRVELVARQRCCLVGIAWWPGKGIRYKGMCGWAAKAAGALHVVAPRKGTGALHAVAVAGPEGLSQWRSKNRGLGLGFRLGLGLGLGGAPHAAGQREGARVPQHLWASKCCCAPC